MAKTRRLKKAGLLLVWVILWIFLFLGIAELAVRMRVINPSFEMLGVTYILDNQVLFRIKPRGSSEIGPYGNRVTTAPPRQDAPRRIVLLGDSFTFGSNVGRDETIAAYLEKQLGDDCEVLNMGCVGYGPDQALLWMKSAALRLQPDAVILLLFPANDFSDLHKNRLFHLSDDGAIHRSPTNSLRAQMPRFQSSLIWDLILSTYGGQPSQFTDIYKSFFFDKYDMDLIDDPKSAASRTKRRLMRGVLRDFRDTLRNEDIAFLTVLIPPIEPFADQGFFASRGVPEEKWFRNEDTAYRICGEVGIDCINLYTNFQAIGDCTNFYDLVDQHLSPLGYEETARIISGHLAAQGLLPGQ